MTENKNNYLIEYNGMYCKFYPIIVKLYPQTITENVPYSELPEYVYGKVQIGYSGFYPFYHYTTIHKSKIIIRKLKNHFIKWYSTNEKKEFI